MKRKIYEPVREFERQTSYCPLYLAGKQNAEGQMLKAKLFQHSAFGLQTFSKLKLARRAEAVFARHPFADA